MPKGIPNKRYTGEFKQEVVETMHREKLSYMEVARLYDITAHDRVASWERIYLEEGPEGLYIEWRGRRGKGRSSKKLKPEVEEDLLAEVQRLRAENAYGDSLKDDLFKDKVGLYSAREIGRTARERKAGSLGYAEAMLIAYNRKMKCALKWSRLYSNKSEVPDEAELEDEESNDEEDTDSEQEEMEL